MSVVRATSLSHYPALVAELGGDPAALLRANVIRLADVGKPDAFVPLRNAIGAVECAATATGTQDFGLRLARRQGIEIMGPVGVAARTAATPGDALRIFGTFMAAYSPAIMVEVVPGEDAVHSFLQYRIQLTPSPPCEQVMELSLGVILRVLRLLLGPRYSPVTVHLPHEFLSPRADYVRYFSCPVLSAQPVAGMTVLSADLQRPLRHDVAAHQVLVDYLQTLVGQTTDSDVVDAARCVIRRLLPTGALTVDLLAAQFNLHPKALQRRLAANGTNFSNLVDEVRKEVTEHHLRYTDLNLMQVTRALGYTEQSVLTRSCKRWFGAGPAKYRLATRQARG